VYQIAPKNFASCSKRENSNKHFDWYFFNPVAINQIGSGNYNLKLFNYKVRQFKNISKI
jgi:hypothetical protein